MNKTLSLLLLMPLAAAAQGRAGSGYTIGEATGYRSAWTLSNWDDGGELSRYVFLNMPEFWTHSVIDRSGPVRGLPPTVRNAVANFLVGTDAGEVRLADYVAGTTVDGLIVLHEGRIVYEVYPRMRASDKHLYMSVSKPFASLLVGILEDRGLVDSAAPIDTYLPELAGGGWEGVPVIDVLDMASGIDCRQEVEGAYEDPATCYYQFEAALGWLPPTEATSDDVHAWVAGLASARPSGELYEYTSVNTFVLRWLVERVTGQTYADAIATLIWQRMGAESDALIVAPVRGTPIAASGISSTLRDLARFGLLFTPSGRIGANPVVSDALLAKIRAGGRPDIYSEARRQRAAAAAGDAAPDPAAAAAGEPETEAAADGAADGQAGEHAVAGEAPRHNTYQWDRVMVDGDFFKGGYGGQGLYVSPGRDLVIAFFGTMNEDGSGHELPAIARRLATSGLFRRVE